MIDAFSVGGFLLGVGLTLILPGLTWSYVLFGPQEISLLDRFMASIGLSLALVPTSALLAYLFFDVPVTQVSTAILVTILTGIGVAVAVLRKHGGKGLLDYLKGLVSPARRRRGD